VAGIIVPWNGPVVLGMNPAVQALMAGNTVLIKASEVTPYSTKIIEEIFTEAGLPAGVLQVLLGDGETGAALCEAGVDKIAFTGSVNTGRQVAQSCARQLIPCTLELGGKDAMIVCADADLDRAAAGAVIGSCMNSGHYCCGTERIYVLDAVYDEFLDKVVAQVKALRQGSQLGYDEDVGAVFWDRQMTVIEDHVQDAVDKGATIVVGGQRNPELAGLYYQPTVMTNVNHDMKIMREETFGPIICVQRVASEEAALGLANDSRYGLNGNVWSRNTRHAIELAERVETGGISVNDMALTYGVPVAPFGGIKESGVGRVNGEVGIRGYCHAVPVIIERFGGKKLPSAYPHSAAKVEGMKKFMRFLWGTPVGKWLS
jgi:succinate-semialdehyde dehydrogenase/glutarate-semialdehyde dehydrogenase